MGQKTAAFNVGRPAEEIVLRLIAQFFLQELKFGLGLDALGEHRQAKPAAKAQDRGHNSCRLIVGVDRLDERPVDLDLVEREIPKTVVVAETASQTRPALPSDRLI